MEALEFFNGVPTGFRNLTMISYLWADFVVYLVDEVFTCIQLFNRTVICAIETNTSLFIYFTDCTFVWEFTSL